MYREKLLQLYQCVCVRVSVTGGEGKNDGQMRLKLMDCTNEMLN